MRFFTRMLVCVATALVICTALFSFTGSWFGDRASLLRHCRSLLFETRRSQALIQRSELVSKSMEIKKAIIDRLIAGRLDLREAIIQFQEINDRIDNLHLEWVPEYHKPADPESTGRQVLAWVECEVASWPPDKDKRILVILKREYLALFSAPDSPEGGSRSRGPSEARRAGSIRGSD